MDLSLLPLTAILLLLSGVAVPRTATAGLPAIACVRLCLRLGVATAAATQAKPRAAVKTAAPHADQRLLLKAADQRLAARVRRVVLTCSQMRHRTRFGTAGVVYRSLAPPTLSL